MKKIICYIVAATILVCIIIAGIYYLTSFNKQKTLQPATFPSNNQEAQAFFQNRGKLSMQKRQYQSLIATYQRAIAIAPDSSDLKTKLADVYYELAVIELDIGNKPAAIKNLEGVIKYNPKHIEAKKLLEDLQKEPLPHN